MSINTDKTQTAGRTLYAITAQVLTRESDRNGQGVFWTGSRQVPTFYLDAAVQGIVSERHAVSIARDVIDPLGALNTVITAEKVPE